MVLIVITGRECTVLLSPNAKNQKGMKRVEIGKNEGELISQTPKGSLYASLITVIFQLKDADKFWFIVFTLVESRNHKKLYLGTCIFDSTLFDAEEINLGHIFRKNASLPRTFVSKHFKVIGR